MGCGTSNKSNVTDAIPVAPHRPYIIDIRNKLPPEILREFTTFMKDSVKDATDYARSSIKSRGALGATGSSWTGSRKELIMGSQHEVIEINEEDVIDEKMVKHAGATIVPYNDSEPSY